MSGQVVDTEVLLRTDFSPEHIVDGQLVPAGISSKDLTNRGFSVDRKELVESSVIYDRAKMQMARQPEKRTQAWIATFECGGVCSEKIDDMPAFRIDATPLEDNPAHASLYAALRQPAPSIIKRLKSILLPHLNKKIEKLEIPCE